MGNAIAPALSSASKYVRLRASLGGSFATLSGRSGIPMTVMFYRRSKPRKRSQSVTDDSYAASSMSALWT